MGAAWKAAAAGLVAAVVAVIAQVPALADAPGNDSEGSAIEVGALPFVHSADTSGARGDGPRFCANDGSVFYRFTPSADVRVQVDSMGSEFDTVLAVYTRDSSGAVVRIGCDDDRFGSASGLRFRARAGTTYFIMAAECCGNGETGGGPLVVTVTEATGVDLEVTNEITFPVTIDPASSIVTISGTATCNARSIIYPSGALRQIRNSLYVVRAWYWAGVPCDPGAAVPWSVEVDAEDVIAFAPGAATLRTWDGATDGWDWLDLDRLDRSVDITSG